MGRSIGQATEDIPAGGHIHSHNLGMGPHSSTDYAIGSAGHPAAAFGPANAPSWAITALTGQVGTRNYIGILTSVNCSGSVARFIAEAAEKDPIFVVDAQY